MKKNLATLLPLVGAMGAGAAALAYQDGGGDPQPLPWCVKVQWFNSTITCYGGCGVQYTICPGRILCAKGLDFQSASGVYSAFANCRLFVGGSGSCPSCTGGTETIPSGVTTPGAIFVQDGADECVTNPR